MVDAQEGVQAMTILMIEDNQKVTELVIAEARRFMPDFIFVTAGTMEAGAQLAAAGGFDAVLIDLSLPDSISATDNIAQLRAVTDAPIIVLSGSIRARDIHDAIRAGADDYLSKHVIPNAMMQIFVSILAMSYRREP
jgi:CheY-like chemotaxis protein